MNSDFKDLLKIFAKNNVEYLIVGGYAVMEYGEPRYTKDLDIWIWASPANAAKVFDSLHQFGAPLLDVTPMDFAEPGVVYQIGIEPVRIDILMSIDGVEFEDAWARRSHLVIEEVDVWMISRGDLIKNKRASGRPQDLIDADRLEQASE